MQYCLDTLKKNSFLHICKFYCTVLRYHRQLRRMESENESLLSRLDALDSEAREEREAAAQAAEEAGRREEEHDR